MSYVYVPAALRRTGHQLSTTTVERRGFCSLPVQQGHQLQAGVQFARSLPDRALAEFLLELAEKRADVPEMLRTLTAWRERLTPQMVVVSGGGRFPSKPVHEVAQ